METGTLETWSAYVRLLAGDEPQSRIGERAGVNQTTASHWLRGRVAPKTASAAAFAVSFGRNPIEAFIAAGLLDLEHGAAALGADELALLADLGIGTRKRT